MAGEGSGNNYAAASMVAGACQMLRDRGLVRIEYLDPEGMQVQVAGRWRIPSFDVCGLYQYREDGASVP